MPGAMVQPSGTWLMRQQNWKGYLGAESWQRAAYRAEFAHSCQSQTAGRSHWIMDDFCVSWKAEFKNELNARYHFCET